MIQLVFLPVLIPLATAILLIPLRPIGAQRLLSATSTVAVLALSLSLLVVVHNEGIQVYKQGDWPPPFGITLVADLLSAGMLAVTMTVGAVAILYSLTTLDRERERFHFHPLFHFLLMGVNGTLLTGDIFNLFVFFEVMLIASYGLVALGGAAPQLEATIKYASINLVGTTLLVGAVGLIYGLLGTLNMADLSRLVAESPNQGLLTPIAMVFLIVFGIKAAVFALWFWMPGTYTVVPPGLSAYFGGVLTKVGVYTILRVFTLIFIHDPPMTHTIILLLAAPTMLIGVLGAAAQYQYRTILTWHISSQVGYMIMGVGFFTVAGIAGAIFFTFHNVLVKSTLFLTGGFGERASGSLDIRKMGGLLTLYPVPAFLFIIAALSLAGVPPLSGFWGKVLLIKAGIEAGGWLNFLVVGISLIVSLLTLYSMIKIWQYAYWRAPVTHPRVSTGFTWGTALPIAILVALILFVGVYPKFLMDFSIAAAEQLMTPSVYIEAVLGSGGGTPISAGGGS